MGTLPPASSRKKAARDENTKNKGGGAHSGGGAAMTNSAAKSGREGEKRAGVENPSKGGSGGGGSSGGVGGNRNSSSGVQGVSRKRVRVVDEKLGEFSVVLQPYLGGESPPQTPSEGSLQRITSRPPTLANHISSFPREGAVFPSKRRASRGMDCF